MTDFPDYAQISNLNEIEALYARYLENPENVEPSWRHFFEGIDFAKILHQRGGGEKKGRDEKIARLIQAYRTYGHLKARINPLADDPSEPPELSLSGLGFELGELSQRFPTFGFCPTAEAPLQEIIAALERIYASRIGFEYMGLDQPDMERWIQEKIEGQKEDEWTDEDRLWLLEQLSRAEAFETFLHTKYVGQRRFSLEGGETLLALLNEIIDVGAAFGMEQFVLGMAHRGRLNVLANLLDKPYAVIFQEFEDTFLPMNFEGSGDVKYHKGFSADIKTRRGKPVHLHLAANSSCLESVDPIALGLTRGKQVLTNDRERKKVGCLLIHGDASLAGQGVVYESLELMRLEGYSTGGTLHIVVNNQIGFTTLPEEGRSTRYCTDIAKTFGCPVFHVNAEDPESCIFAARLAIALRLQFQRDVFIDLNCYRKYGHNEGDEPAFTQPLHYKIIRSKPSIRTLYLQHIATQSQRVAEIEQGIRTRLDQALQRAKEPTPHPPEQRFGVSWKTFQQPAPEKLLESFPSAAPRDLLTRVAQGLCTVPASFHLHPKLQKWVAERQAMVAADPNTPSIDWAMAESLAFGTLVTSKVPVRLAGQDARRGTFSQRHAVWVDQEDGSCYIPLAHLSADQARFDIYNSPLSEFACLAFEFGYTWASPEGLVLWEAQFGDFTIGAQTVIDHYIMSAEHKWARYSSLVLLLPHGYEGQGPEHSSARIERFLQLAALSNTQIANPTTPAQYFHLLRRQALRPVKKPLIVLTPKSLLRHPSNLSPLAALTNGTFEELLPDAAEPSSATRVLLCSGKIYYDLVAEKEKRKSHTTAIIRVEQVYPFHRDKAAQMLSGYSASAQFCYVQEEPENMGAWEFLAPSLRASLPQGAPLRYIGRPRSAVTATGSFAQHRQEQEKIFNEAFA
jgi:2-oxoglutarate dehydrogenase E1 component